MSKEKLTSEEMGLLSAQYELEFDPAQKVPETGDKNQVVFLTASDGSRYVVKKYASDFTPEIAGFQLRVNDFLVGQNVPTPSIVRNKDGALLSIHDNELYSLMSFIEGHHPSVDDQDEVNLAFQGLAMFNAALANFPKNEDLFCLPRFSATNRESFDKLCPHLPKTASDAASRYVISQIGRVDELITEVKERCSAIDHPKQLIHGDYNLGCALIKNGVLAGVIDYDLLRIDWRGVDAMHTVDLYGFDKETERLELAERVDWEKVQACFSEYKRHDPTITDQVYDLPLMLANVGLNGLIGTWKLGYSKDSTDSEREYFSRRYAFFNNRVEIAMQLEDKLIKTLQDA